MTFAELPWLEFALLACAIGTVGVLLSRSGLAWAVAGCGAALVCATTEWACYETGWSHGPGPWRLPMISVDAFSAPLLPLTAFLHLLTALSTPRAEGSRGFFVRLLVSLGLQLATFGTPAGWPLIALLAAGTIVPMAELRGRALRLFSLHMGLFIVMLAAGWACVGAERPVLGGVMLLGALLVRGGTVPLHAWVTTLFEHAHFGTAILFTVPMVAVYAAARLVVPAAPEWALRGLGAFSLATAVLAAGLAVVQVEARRLFAYLLLSHSALVMVGLELLTPVCLAGSLSLWVACAQSLAGLGLVLRAVEARFGRLRLDRYQGFYAQSPALAAGVLLMGLATVGFPGTPGFASTELLVDGTVTANPFIGLGVVHGGLLNGIAVMRAYFRLFTGARHESSVPLGITFRERIVLLSLTLLLLFGGLFPQPGLASRHAAAQQLLTGRIHPPAPH